MGKCGTVGSDVGAGTSRVPASLSLSAHNLALESTLTVTKPEDNGAEPPAFVTTTGQLSETVYEQASDCRHKSFPHKPLRIDPGCFHVFKVYSATRIQLRRNLTGTETLTVLPSNSSNSRALNQLV